MYFTLKKLSNMEKNIDLSQLKISLLFLNYHLGDNDKATFKFFNYLGR